MTDRLRRALAYVEQLPIAVQDELATRIEEEVHIPHVSLASIDFSVFADLPDDAVDVLDRWRHESIPTPPYEEPE